MIEATLQLGSLEPLFNDYRSVVDQVKDGETRTFKRTQADAEAKFRELCASQLSLDTTDPEILLRLRDQALNEELGADKARQRLLRENKFVGDICGLFKNVLEFEEALNSAEIVTDPVCMDEMVDDLNVQLALWDQVPVDRRKGALLVSERGYYWGGTLTSFDVAAQ